mmetsp:Transcript_1549/g.2983  ORF Transcript_1549/g.2983 Transcript_1549/m.2983 type:complete len:83 (+) Transcript_1549:488-736(+)
MVWNLKRQGCGTLCCSIVVGPSEAGSIPEAKAREEWVCCGLDDRGNVSCSSIPSETTPPLSQDSTFDWIDPAVSSLNSKLVG